MTLALVDKCESDGERKFFAALRKRFDEAVDVVASRRGVLSQQVWVETADHGYRLDFGIQKRFGFIVVSVGVELDSHAFHSATDKDATYDRVRDRALARAGWFTLRFSGSEIAKNADNCAVQVSMAVDGIGDSLLSWERAKV
jgi:very-short-patch-repair endonuclease